MVVVVEVEARRRRRTRGGVEGEAAILSKLVVSRLPGLVVVGRGAAVLAAAAAAVAVRGEGGRGGGGSTPRAPVAPAVAREEEEEEEEEEVVDEEESGAGARPGTFVREEEEEDAENEKQKQEQGPEGGMEDWDDECALCFISMVDPPDQVVMDLLCFHSYHRRCVSDWRDHCKSKQVPLSCPMCRDTASEMLFA